MGLPPELDRLGNVLTHASARAAARRRTRADRRRRVAGGLAAGLFEFAAMTPAQHQSADQPDILRFATSQRAEAAVVCDRPRGPHFQAQGACDGDPAPPAAR
jgi:hypothetical protein